jgi:DNA-binding PadR family transcriptional regulator
MGPCSGYDIKKRCDMSISHFWAENYGHIYPMLKKLESEGMVTKQPQQTGGRPPKTVYQITDKGAADLKEWLLKPAEHHPMRFEFLLKVFFAQDLPPAEVITKLRAERQGHMEQLEVYRGIEAMLTGTEPTMSAPGLPFWLASLDFGRRFSTATVQWCDDTIKAIEKRAGETGAAPGNERN